MRGTFQGRSLFRDIHLLRRNSRWIDEMKGERRVALAGIDSARDITPRQLWIFYLSQPLALSTTIVFASCRACNFFLHAVGGFPCLFIPSRSMYVDSRFFFYRGITRLLSLNRTNADCHAKLPWKKRGRVSWANIVIL